MIAEIDDSLLCQLRSASIIPSSHLHRYHNQNLVHDHMMQVHSRWVNISAAIPVQSNAVKEVESSHLYSETDGLHREEVEHFLERHSPGCT